MLFGRRKPGYTTTVDGAADPEQVVLDLQKAEMVTNELPLCYHFSFFAACKRKRTVKLDVLPFFVGCGDRT